MSPVVIHLCIDITETGDRCSGGEKGCNNLLENYCHEVLVELLGIQILDM